MVQYLAGANMKRDDIILFLRDFKKPCGEKYGIISLAILGSVARGDMRDDSDIDICVTTRTPDSFKLVHMKKDIEKLLHRRVDIVRLRDKMNPSLKKRIDQESVYV